MPLSEADIRAQLNDPKLRQLGWSDSLITREHSYRRDQCHTAGRIYLVGDGVTCLVEATDEQLSLEQCLDYTRRKVVGYVPEWARLWEVWVEPVKRHAFLDRYREEAREVILALLDNYRIGGMEQLADPKVFQLSPFREMGQAPGVIRRFGGAEQLQEMVHDL